MKSLTKAKQILPCLRQPATKKCLKGMKTCTYFTVLVIMIKNIKTVTITIKEMILNTKMQF